MLWIDYFRERDTTKQVYLTHEVVLWIDYFRERDTTFIIVSYCILSCGLITLGNEIQPSSSGHAVRGSCGLITLGNEIQPIGDWGSRSRSCGLITLGNEIQRLPFYIER